MPDCGAESHAALLAHQEAEAPSRLRRRWQFVCHLLLRREPHTRAALTSSQLQARRNSARMYALRPIQPEMLSRIMSKGMLGSKVVRE